MGAFDKIVAAVSPRRACEREAWRQQLEILRGYDAAGYGRLNAGWRVHNESAEVTDRFSRDVVRARARDLERNSDIAQSILHAYKRNVVGKGYTLQAKTGNDELDEKLEKAWRQWCKARNCDVTGEQSFNQMLRMAVDRKKVDGGLLFLYRYTKQGLVPFQLQAIEVDELDVTASKPKHQGNRVVGGIEYNQWRRPVGYWSNQYDIEGWSLNDPVYVEAKDVYFYKSKKRPSQLREMSDMAPTITRVRDTNEFITAVSVKERIAACLAVFIKRAIPAGGFGRGGTRTPDGGMDYEGKKLAPGMIQSLGAGDEIQVVDPKGSGSDAAGFLKTQQGLIAAGQGLSYEAVSRDMSGATYSSARQNAIEDENTYTEDVELLTDFMSEVYETFVISCYLSGLVDMPGFWDKKAEYLSHTWTKAPKKWIDPAKESTAGKTALQSGQKTFQDVCAEQGKDWKEAVNEMAEVLEYGRSVGVELGGVILEMERQQHSRTPQANDPKRDRNSGQRSMGHIEANSRAEGQEDSRRRTISFSSEEPYRRWFGMEILDHAENALDLSRLNDVGVLLFNHDTDKVVGKVIRAWVENHRGMAEVEFDTDDDAEKIFGKVKSGTLKTTSVRYSVDSWEEVVAGKTSADGRFTGPCQIARKWTPLEVSIVSVPADATVGVGRADDPEQATAKDLSVYEKQIQINKNLYH